MSRSIELRGVALHLGAPSSVVLRRIDGPITIALGGAREPLESFRVARADRGVTIEAGSIAIDLVEHLFAAMGGVGARSGVAIEASTTELPLLDGGAKAFADALRAIDAPASPPLSAIVSELDFAVGASRYRFERADRVELQVDVEFPPPVGRESAEWCGDPDDFVERIAPARTFGWANEIEALLASRRARGLAGGSAQVDLASVIVFDGAGVMKGSTPPSEHEVARHKLLDLIGDLAIRGGPPRGRIHATRPGHAATHAAISEALRLGVIST